MAVRDARRRGSRGRRGKGKNTRFLYLRYLALMTAALILIGAAGFFMHRAQKPSAEVLLEEGLPSYEGEPYVEIGGNKPSFGAEDLEKMEGLHFSELDSLGRCGPAWACLTRSMMPETDREEIRDIRPSGWHTVKYPELIEDLFLYNRCHLLAFCLTGENANEQNLITGTRYMNKEGMLPFETSVADYLDHSDNHVLYRVTPHFAGRELVARGVEIEALSVEDGGAGICFHVFVFNVQPRIEIDYLTGESRATDSS